MDSVDVNFKCRACLTMDPLQLFDWNVEMLESITYMDCFRQCTQLEELVDEPSMLCYSCASELKSSYDFIQKCRECDVALRLKTELIDTTGESPVDKLNLKRSTMIHVKNLTSPARMSDESSDAQYEVETADSSSLPLDEVETSKVKCKRRRAEVIPAKATKKPRRGLSRKKSHESDLISQDIAENCSETLPKKCHKKVAVQILFSSPKKKQSKREHEQKRHTLSHEDTRERNFTCDFCGLKFLTKSHCSKHEQTHESNRQRQFQCDQCDKEFFYMGGLNEHKKLHTDNTLECQICKKLYFRPIDLEIHLRSHSGETPYQCKYCDKAFKQVDKLNIHVRKHEGYRYKCDICEKEYSDPSTLRQHRMEHTGLPLKCGVCRKGFAKKSKIRVHVGGVHKVKDTAEMEKLIIAVKK